MKTSKQERLQATQNI